MLVFVSHMQYMTQFYYVVSFVRQYTFDPETCEMDNSILIVTICMVKSIIIQSSN